MLTIQRASAGSGKTFTLARQFIWFFITVRPEGEARRLRTDAELEDSLSHILAVTFTNKATNEMQMRIVDSLNSLASYRPGDKVHKYMEHFASALKVGYSQIARVCGRALRVLLANYSDFNVSTIDSFFQLVLRTFAYETDISDSYRVELESDFLSRMAINTMLDEIDSGECREESVYWVRRLIESDKSGKWNIFQKKEVAPGYGTNPYTELLRAINRLDNEDFRAVRDVVEDYFRTGPDFKEVFETLHTAYDGELERLLSELGESAAALDRAIPDDLREMGAGSDLGRLARFGKNCMALAADNPLVYTSTKKMPELDEVFFAKNAVAKYFKKYPEAYGSIYPLASEASERYRKLIDYASSGSYRHWMLYRKNIPFLGLMRAVEEKRRGILDESNSVELGETSSILSRIIGDSDTPFIYERLGTYLNHFLIDEFQDTSRMQWHNLRPLLSESLSRGNDNLIIGDAKQSIYRFRNADPSLITKTVPAQFSAELDPDVDSESKNTNWRSSLRVVQFNNSFFRYLADGIDGYRAAGDSTPRLDFKTLYSNVVQKPNNEKESGYVKVTVPDAGNKAEYGEVVSKKVPAVIEDALARGYRMRDIAVLVRTHNEGEAVIAAIMAHNNDVGRKIDFVSEDSLKLISSEGVRILEAALRSVASGARPEINKEKKEGVRENVGNWADMECAFRFFALDHAEMPLAEQVRLFISEGSNFDALGSVLAEMQTLALPALVEALAGSGLMPSEVRRRDAVFISAFQDIVLEYCEERPTDIASFLTWWERKRQSASIASPKDTDAVRIITIHKAKGLEYPCVIVPFVTSDLSDTLPKRASEWRWVEPQLEMPAYAGKLRLPPYMPVAVDESLADTVNSHLLTEYYDMLRMDELNATYVAFTRAVDELHIFAFKGSEKEEARIARFLLRFAEEWSGDPKAGLSLLPSDLIRMNDDSFEIGEPLVKVKDKDKEEKKEGGKDEKEEDGKKEKHIIIADYPAHHTPDYMKYREENLASLPAYSDAEEMDGVEEEPEELDLDPRSEGNIKHALLERICVVGDLEGALRHLTIDGTLLPDMVDEIRESLSEKLSDPEAVRWFGEDVRVITERPLLHRGATLRRPDRIVVFPDGHAEVVDYKFGKVRKDRRYSRQMHRYVELLKSTGLFTKVRGYLWYVNEGVVQYVCD